MRRRCVVARRVRLRRRAARDNAAQVGGFDCRGVEADEGRMPLDDWAGILFDPFSCVSRLDRVVLIE